VAAAAAFPLILQPTPVAMLAATGFGLMVGVFGDTWSGKQRD
jgi:hypothetical protein